MQCTGWTGTDARQAAHACGFNHDHRTFWMAAFNRFSAKGNKASKGQKGMHRSQPVQAESVMPTMACPMLGGPAPTF